MKNKTPIIFIILLIITLFAALDASASTDNTGLNDDNLILLKAEYINTENFTESEEKINDKSTADISIMSIEDTENYYIVQFTGPVRDSWKKEVTSAGATIYNYVPNNAFIFKMNDEVKNQIRSMDFVKWIGEYKPSYKYDPELIDTSCIQVASPGADHENTYHVLLFSSDDHDSIASYIELLGGNIISWSGNTLKVQISTDILPEITAINGVCWIEEYVLPTVNNDIAANITNAYAIHNTYGLNGSGQIVAVCDSGLDTGVNDNSMHEDLRGRIIDIFDVSNDGSSADQLGHGTHVAGSVLGNGSLSGGKYSGMAPEASLVFQAAGNSNNYLILPDDLNDLFQQAYDLGARIHTNSWGSAASGTYTLSSQQIDQFMWEHPDMLILFSAGNEGVDSDENGVIDEDSIGAPATAKNCLTVGAAENERGDTFGVAPYLIWGTGSWLEDYPVNPIRDDYMADDSNGIAAFSSRGPTNDGRIKPDVVAPGTFIASTRSSIDGSSSGWGVIDENYLYMGGTSMSTPITAGSAAIVREYYAEVENLSSPSAALIKATLINGAHDMTPGQYGTDDYQEIDRRPDYSQGWGRIDIENSIYPQYPTAINYFDNPSPLNTGDSWNVSYDVLYTSEPLRVTLVWTDYPGSAFVDPQLVNKLDLLVTGPGGTYCGNGAPDDVNNVEGVELIEPAAGTYRITVNGANVPQGPQNFSLVISYGQVSTYMYPEHDSYTTNSMTEVYINLTHTDGVDLATINMTIDGSQVDHTTEPISGGYRVENITAQPYSEGEHNVSVSALTNLNEEISYGWRFYASIEDNVITIQGLEENSVILEENFDINVSNRKYCDFWYNIDTGTNSTIETGYAFNKTLNLTEGQHNLTVFAEDITGHINFTTVNFTVFTSQPTVDSPESGTIYYLPTSGFSINGSAGIATNVSVYVNGAITNLSYPVSNGRFNISGIPLLNGTNAVNVTSILNNSEEEYFSPNTTLYLSLGKTFNTYGNDEVTLPVPGIGSNISYPELNFNITGISANPGNLSAAIVRGNEPGSGSVIIGDAIDIRVINESDANYSHQFGRNVSLTLGYDPYLVNDTAKLTVAWYDPDEGIWVPFRSIVNTSAHTVTANITHLSIYAPLEDNTAPVISDLAGSRTSSSITLTWNESEDTDHVEVWRNGAFLGNNSDAQMTDTGLSASTSYVYGLKAIDFAGNVGNWSNTTITTSASTTSTSGSRSSGSGGGSGGSSGEDNENIVFKDVLSVYAGKDEIVEFDFNDKKNDIDYVRYLSLKNAGKITVTIEVLKNTSTFSSSSAPGTVYRNLNIWVGKTGYATEDNIKDPQIGFRVDREWILDNEIDPSSIGLHRYSDGVWGELSTEQSGSDDDYLYFEAKTPGFSPFAITGKNVQSLTENVVDGNILLKEEVKTSEVPLSEETSYSGDESSTSYEMLFIYAGSAGFILSIAYLLIRKQQN